MELCNGGDLDNFRRKRGGYLQETEARVIICQIMQGLGDIKAKNVMHRDLKLPNIMINFPELPNSVVDPFILQEYIKNFDF